MTALAVTFTAIGEPDGPTGGGPSVAQRDVPWFDSWTQDAADYEYDLRAKLFGHPQRQSAACRLESVLAEAAFGIDMRPSPPAAFT